MQTGNWHRIYVWLDNEVHYIVHCIIWMLSQSTLWRWTDGMTCAHIQPSSPIQCIVWRMLQHVSLRGQGSIFHYVLLFSFLNSSTAVSVWWVEKHVSFSFLSLFISYMFYHLSCIVLLIRGIYCQHRASFIRMWNVVSQCREEHRPRVLRRIFKHERK